MAKIINEKNTVQQQKFTYKASVGKKLCSNFILKVWHVAFLIHPVSQQLICDFFFFFFYFDLLVWLVYGFLFIESVLTFPEQTLIDFSY